ncbi:hypothetical protein [Sphingomonas sp.]|uniref:hypothetical protein n=1 Tax=Sphingomonas sp. TaxID=28214 RepID=UPI003CC6BB2B
MIAVVAATALAADDGDLDRLRAAATACDRTAVSRAWADEQRRHGDFVIASLHDQASIVTDRAALTERRRLARTAGGIAGLAAQTADAADLDDRQRALDDQRRLDTMRQEAVTYFRQLYITQCNGRDR